MAHVPLLKQSAVYTSQIIKNVTGLLKDMKDQTEVHKIPLSLSMIGYIPGLERVMVNY